MNARVWATLAAVLVVAVAGVGLFRGSSQPPADPAVSPETASAPPGAAARPAPAATPLPARPAETSDSPRSREEARAAVERAREAHDAATAAFEDAKVRLDDIELEIATVEGFVDDIKERGEDPTDYAFEGLERLNPVMERLDELVANVEAAEREAQRTALDLERATRTFESFASP